MRWVADKIRGQADESELSSGMLYSTGLVAGGCIAGLLLVLAWKFFPTVTHFGEGLQERLGETPGSQADRIQDLRAGSSGPPAAGCRRARFQREQNPCDSENA
jgi:hypothetical protein